ncbi:MAG TPA: VWA domain-containing protein [Ignavibacteriaceae bacterium]|nr:VWA domain-containing protein [Ignavibacteriaceae bacterium]
MFRFAHPEYLNALYLIPVLIFLFWYLDRNRKRLLDRFADKKLHRILLPDFSGFKNWFKFSLILFALVLLIFAAANPQVGTRVQEVKQTGIDVFIALDVSRSMLAEDIKPDRLDKAKYQISSLINKLRGDRIGLIIFAGEAYIQFPLTTDYSAANLFLSAVDVNSVPQQGTAIASAIELAVKSFDYKTSTQKVIVIITDGEDHEGDIMQAVQGAKDKSIKIYTIGLGSVTGVPIPVYNAQGQQVDYKKDENGNIVLTKLDENILKQIASAGDGKYFLGSTYEDYLDRIYSDLSSLEKSEFGVRKVTDYEDRFYYFLAPAIILLLIEFFVTERRSILFDKLNRKLGFEEKV